MSRTIIFVQLMKTPLTSSMENSSGKKSMISTPLYVKNEQSGSLVFDCEKESIISGVIAFIVQSHYFETLYYIFRFKCLTDHRYRLFTSSNRTSLPYLKLSLRFRYLMKVSALGSQQLRPYRHWNLDY